ncbi:hypothetical protein QJS10_CPB22g01153 [Acorus calamus]|uniref:Uncharacterized protein n=1 Tax=Acorus calamus TaxID=4465 RepID=A0AAV9C1N5_ACOCL|nr:hypothetical protein QJS10_CPB22g01153 [Acorus calamus]
MALPGALGSVKQRRSTDSASNSEGEDMEDDAHRRLFSYALWPVWRFLAIPLTIVYISSPVILGNFNISWKELIYDSA